jgi:transcriptional regulator with XRE-family HTH domain
VAKGNGLPLAEIRQARGLRQVDLAALAGVCLPTLTRLENGPVAGVSVGILVRVAHALGLAPVELIPALGARPGRARVALKLREVPAERGEG